MRKWKEIHSQHFLILSLFPLSLSISYIKICHTLSQNVKMLMLITRTQALRSDHHDVIITTNIYYHEKTFILPIGLKLVDSVLYCDSKQNIDRKQNLLQTILPQFVKYY